MGLSDVYSRATGYVRCYVAVTHNRGRYYVINVYKRIYNLAAVRLLAFLGKSVIIIHFS